MSNVFIGTAENFNKEGKSHDKHGAQNIAISPMAGVSPRGLNVVAGTVAKNSGIESGNTYLFNAIETEPYTDPRDGRVVRRFNFKVVGKLSALEVFEMMQSDKVAKLRLVIQPDAEDAAAAAHTVDAEAVDLGVDPN